MVATIRTLEPTRYAWSCDGRVDPTAIGGVALVASDVLAATHTAVAALVGVTALPFLDASNNPLPPSAPLSQMSAARRTALQTALEARHVPTDDFTLASTVRDVLERIVARFNMRQVLAAVDYTEGLDTLVSAIAPARRQQINQALTAAGFDTSSVVLADTVRLALRKTLLASAGRFGLGAILPGDLS